jgi:acyl-CoA reductase-like NAD-dependent aldehyde dehydrogenase
VLVGRASEIGDVLVEDESVRLISFTGSAEVGWKLRERAARKKVLLELGNATPVVVEADADVEEAATKAAANAFSFAGQSCISIQRVYVARAAYDDFLARFLPKVEALRVGDPSDDATDVGPVIDSDSKERILEWIAEAKAQGATVLSGGEANGDGLIPPTVLGNVTPEMKVSCLEVFGPLCTVTPYDSLDEAIALANGTEYGLQAGIFTGSVKTAMTAASGLEFGGVLVNEAPTFRADQMPYGGVKASGNTKEGPHYSIREMTEERLVVIAR